MIFFSHLVAGEDSWNLEEYGTTGTRIPGSLLYVGQILLLFTPHATFDCDMNRNKPELELIKLKFWGLFIEQSILINIKYP